MMTQKGFTPRLVGSLAVALGLLSGCQFYARGPEDYRAVTRELVETRSSKIHDCYEEILKKTPDAAGTVVVRFDLEPKTGKLVAVAVQEESTAPKELGACVVNALEGLALEPPDERKGEATFSWEFKKKG
jgi:hypothetical protein